MDRPVYSVTVTNLDRAWTLTATEGDVTPEPTPAVLLVDPFSISWGFASGQIPGPLDPEAVSFVISSATAADVPPVDTGDLFVVRLERPTDDDPILYMEFSGRATDPVADTQPGKRVLLSVTCTSAPTELNVSYSPVLGGVGDHDPGDPTEDYVAGMIWEATDAQAIFMRHNPREFNRGVFLWERAQLSEQVARIAAGATDTAATYCGVFRALHSSQSAGRFGGGAYDPPPVGIVGPHWVYYLHKCMLHMPSFLTLVEDDTDPDMVILGPDADTVDQFTTLSSRHVDTPTRWTKSRDGLTNHVDVAGAHIITTTFPDTYSSVTVTTRDTTSVARYGTIARSVQTAARESSLDDIGTAYLIDPATASQYSVPELVIRPETMDDAELDQVAADFFPQHVTGVIGRFIILTGVDPDTAVAGEDIAFRQTGASFVISAGKLTITAAVHAVPPPDFATAITFDDLSVTPLADTTFIDTGAGHYIDPALDIDELTYTGI